MVRSMAHTYWKSSAEQGIVFQIKREVLLLVRSIITEIWLADM